MPHFHLSSIGLACILVASTIDALLSQMTLLSVTHLAEKGFISTLVAADLIDNRFILHYNTYMLTFWRPQAAKVMLGRVHDASLHNWDNQLCFSWQQYAS